MVSEDALRALIAKRTVQAQAKKSWDKLREHRHDRPTFLNPPYDNDDKRPAFLYPFPGDGHDFLDLDPTKDAAPGFNRIPFRKIDKVPLDHYASPFDELPKGKEKPPVNIDVGVVGGGMAGLYASLILQDLGLGHEVLEASQRPGGRVWSYHFSEEAGDYYEVGAMLFGDIPIFCRTFKLLDFLNIREDGSEHPKQGCLIPFHFRGPNNPRFYNNIWSVSKEADIWDEGDTFRVSVENGGTVLGKFVRMGHRNVLRQVFDKWKEGLINDFENTWAALMELDKTATSLRAYMINKYKNGYDPVDVCYVTNWCETMNTATNYYDAAFISHLMFSLAFEYPAQPGPTYDPKPILHQPTEKKSVWWILNGGTDIIAKKTVDKLKKMPLYHHRVTGISHDETETSGVMIVSVSQKNLQNPNASPKVVQKKYTHVITTATPPCLRQMDLRRAGLNYAQREAIRVLHYDNALKVGIKFRNRWWADEKGITRGGSGLTDLPTRVVVYPSHALDTPPGQAGVLMACYNWGEDAARFGSLSTGSDKGKAILTAVINDLAILHDYPADKLRDLVISYHVHDWSRDDLIGGHIALLRPGQFSTFFGHLQRPAAMGRLFVAGEVTSIHHGWIVGALNSAYRAIHQMLLCELIRAFPDKDKLKYIWSVICHLQLKWGTPDFELEPEYDTDPMGTAGWQVILGMCGKDV